MLSAAASAVLIDGEDGSRDIAPFPQPVIENVGVRGSLSAIYLGNGVVLTANHVGAGDVTFEGTVYRINDAVTLPEPDRMLAPGAAVLGWLAVRRRRAAAAARAAASAPR